MRFPTFCKWSPPICELLTHPKLEPFLQLPVFWATTYGQFIVHKTFSRCRQRLPASSGLTPPVTGKCSTQKGPGFPAQFHQDLRISQQVELETFRSQTPIWLVVDVSISSGLLVKTRHETNEIIQIIGEKYPWLNISQFRCLNQLTTHDAMFWCHGHGTFRTFQSGIRPYLVAHPT